MSKCSLTFLWVGSSCAGYRCTGKDTSERVSPVLYLLQALAIKTAEASNANYVLAQDPDADRFAAAERKCALGFTQGLFSDLMA